MGPFLLWAACIPCVLGIGDFCFTGLLTVTTRAFPSLTCSHRAYQHEVLHASAITAHRTHSFSADPSQRPMAAETLPVALHGCTASLVTVCVSLDKTHFPSHSPSHGLGGRRRSHQSDSNTTTVTVLAASAATTLSLRVRVCAFRFNLYHKTTTTGTFHNVHASFTLGLKNPTTTKLSR